jgi:hypothetical protein
MERFPESPPQAIAASNLIHALEAIPPISNEDWQQRLGSGLPVEGFAKLPEPDAPLPSETVAALEERLAQVATNLVAVREAMPGEIGLLIRTASLDSWHLSRIALFRQGARLFKMRALLDADRNNPDRAMRAVEDGLRLAEVPSRTPFTIEKLVGFACGDLAVSALETVLARTDPSPASLKDMDAMLNTLDGSLQPPTAELPAASAVYDRLMAMQPEDEHDRDRLFASECMRRWHLVFLAGPATRGWLRLNKAWHLAAMHSAMRNWNQPWPDFQSRYADASRAIPSYCFLSRMDSETFPSVKARQLRTQGNRQCARVALGIKAYAVAKGKLPEQLADLCPKYIPEVGADPFSGQPFHYTVEDGRGQIAFSDPSTGRDVIFRVYPPAKRDQGTSN